LAAGPFFTWQAALVLAYVAVSLALVLVRVRARLRLRDELAAARPVDVRPATAGAPCPVLEHAELGPMVVGALRPRIVLPSLLPAPEEESKLACVLGHESAHVRRRDPWLMAVMQVLLVAFWPVLPLWLAAHRVRALVEMACDGAALADADAGARHRYGHALLDMTEWRSVTLAPLGAGELHFGSALRARIEALANARRWPRAVQVALVALAVVSFAACSSVGSGPSTTGDPATVRGGQGQAWSPPPSGEIANEGELLQYCGALFDVKLRGDTAKMIAAYRTGPTDGLPAEQVAFCRSPAVLEFIDTTAWSAEGRNALGQIGKDIAAAYGKSSVVGNFELCPSGPPVPRTAQAPGVKYQPSWPDDWKDGAGWSCLNFSMSVPMYFRYELVSDGRSFKATAHAQHRNVAGQIVDVTMVLRGEIRPDHVLQIAPKLEETWTVLP
jgi:hypothetical protein